MTQPSIDVLAIGNAIYEGRWKHGRHSIFHRTRYRPPLCLEDMCEGLWVLPSATVWRASRLKALRFDAALRWAEDTEILFRFYAARGRAASNSFCWALLRLTRDASLISRPADGMARGSNWFFWTGAIS